MNDEERYFSEYDGGGVMPSTVHPKPERALTNDERLRLQSLTGQETDTNAPLDPGFWHGNSFFDPNKVPKADENYARQEAKRQRNQARDDRLRYRDTRR